MTSRWTAIAVATAVCACHSSAPRPPRRPDAEMLVKIDIVGNTAISDDELVPRLSMYRALQRHRGLDDYQLGLDVQRISGAYQKRGFFSATVEPEVKRKGVEATLLFHVTEGPRAKASIEIVGLPPEVSLAEARALVPVEEGAPFDYWPYDAAKQPLLALVENRGYAHALLDASVIADRAKNRATLRYVFDTGPKVTFGPIEIHGVNAGLADAIHDHATIHPGDAYSAAAIASTQQAIYGIGRFANVRVDVDTGDLATVVPVKIIAKEAKRWEARAGIGAGLDSLTYQARLRLSLTHAGWPTPLTTLGAEFRPALTYTRDTCVWYEVYACNAEPRIRLLGTATQQDFLRTGIVGEVEGGLDYLALEAYAMEGARVRLGASVPIYGKELLLRAGWQLAGYEFVNINKAVGPRTQDLLGIGGGTVSRLGAFSQAVVVDERDNPVEPTFGAYAELRVAEGSAIAGGEYDYLQLTPDVRGYLPLGRTVLAARARVGVIRGDVPPTERYYAGGASSQRGFAERRLSPEVMTTDPDTNVVSRVVIGGGASVETGVELRTFFWPFGVKMGVVGFLDGADVTETYGDLDASHLHWAAGLGLRPYYLPIGPIRFEVAYRLNRTGPGEPSAGSHWNYLFGVGEAF